MADVDINKFRASVVREGSKPASPGFIVSEGQSPTDPAGSGQNHLPVTITTVATGLSITESQVLGGAGTVGQYIRGDGSLADFPESSGGGSSVSYYLNGSVAQGTIGGVAYKELNKVPILGAGTDFTINANGYIASFLTDAGDPNLLEIPGGNWNFETFFSANNGGGSPTFYVELYKYNGTTFTLIASNSTFPELIAFGTNVTAYFSTLAVPTTTLTLTDRLAIRYYVTHSGRTITLHTENGHLCQIITTFTTGLTALNGLTAQVQNFAVGTSGTDFAIASATATHTFNLPTASATNRGALSSADWTTFNNKTSNLGTVTSVGLSSATSGVTIGSTPVTTSGTITLAIATASGSQNGLLSSTDWTTFNGKQNALTNPVTGTGSAGQIAYFTGTTAITSESGLTWDATNNNLSIGGATANSNLTVSGSDNTNIFTVLAGANSRLHVGTVTTGTLVYLRSQNNYGLNLGINNTDYLSILNTGISVNGNIVLTNGANRFVRIGSVSNYNYDLQTTGDDFQIIEAGTTPRLTIKFPNGNIGINTTTPATTLEVNGVGLFSGGSLVGNTKNGVYIYDTVITSLAGGNSRSLQIQAQTLSIFTGTTYSEKLKVFENGNVVISTSPSDNGAKLQVSGYGSFTVTGDNTRAIRVIGPTNRTGYLGHAFGALFIQNNNYFNGSTYVFDDTTVGCANVTLGQDIGFQTGAANTNPTTKAYITNAGNMGIGTESPGANFSEKLQVTKADISRIGIQHTNTTGARQADILFSVNSTFLGQIGIIQGYSPTFEDQYWVRCAATLPMTFRTNDVERMRITSGGSVGINNTSPMNSAWGTDASTKQLSINGSSYAVINLEGSTARKYSMGVGDGNFYMCYDNTAGRHNLSVTSGGNVMIGTTTDNGVGKLQVNGSITVAGAVRFSSSGTDANRWSVYWNGGNGDLIVVNNISDIRAKKDFDYDIKGLETITKLKPLKFTWKDGISHSTSVSGRLRQYGFIAQETMQADDFLAWHNESHDTWGIEQYESFTAVMVKAIQELKQEIDTLKN